MTLSIPATGTRVAGILPPVYDWERSSTRSGAPSERSLVASPVVATVRAAQPARLLPVEPIRRRPRPRDNGPTVWRPPDGHTRGAVDPGPSRSTIQEGEHTDGADLE
jgi:hypothetical protein